jgi:glycosyltransferase involved in cell wall biosynthesis
MNCIKLSFCIPTYNRVQSVGRLVKDILSCEDSDIEIVVLDNGSTDDTLNILQAIKDDRLAVYSNGENKGALYNMVNVLNKGRGEYLVYSTDQDYVDSNKINQFKTFLSQHSALSCGFTTFNYKSTCAYEIFPQGYEAIKNIAYKGHHPTGYFFNNKLLKTINIVERFSDYEFVDLFPLEFVFAELCLMGSGAIYHQSLFTPETGNSIVIKHKSSTTDGKSKKAFFSPEARLKLAISYAKHINSLQLNQKEKDLLTVDTFINQLDLATIGYKRILGNTDLCIHYYMESKVLSNKELYDIGLNFYIQYVHNVRNDSKQFVNNQCKFLIIVFVRLFQKLVQKALKTITKHA